MPDDNLLHANRIGAIQPVTDEQRRAAKIMAASYCLDHGCEELLPVFLAQLGLKDLHSEP